MLPKYIMIQKKTYEISVEENNVNTKEEVLMRRDDVLHTYKVDVLKKGVDINKVNYDGKYSCGIAVKNKDDTTA